MTRVNANVGQVLVVLLCVLALAPHSRADSDTTTYEWKFATLAPDGTSWAKPIKDVVFPLIESETAGQVSIKVYWGGVMGDDEEILKKMHIGQLHGAGFSAQGTAMAVPEMSVLQLPFLFNDYNEVDLIKYTMFPTFDRIMAERGLFMIAWIDQDFDQIYSTKQPIASLEDFKGVRIASWNGRVEEKFLQMFGANVVQVNVPEMTTTIRQGVADTSVGPAMWQVGTQMYSVYKYVNPIKIRYAPAVIVCRQDVWDAYPELEKYKERIIELRVPLTEAFCIIIRESNQRALKAMIQYGLVPVQTSPADMEEMRRRSIKVWDELAGDLYPRDLLDEIVARLTEYRRIDTRPDWKEKKQEVLAAIGGKRQEVLDIWNETSRRKVTSEDLEMILARANRLNDLYKVAESRVQAASESFALSTAEESVSRMGADGGIWSDKDLRIPLPDALVATAEQLDRSGGQDLVDAFVRSMNRAAELSVKQNRSVIMDVVKESSSMDLETAAGISMASEDSMTRYFEDKEGQTLTQALGRTMPQAMAAAKVDEHYQRMMSAAGGSSNAQGVSNLGRYITGRTVEALFTVMAENEKRFREDPTDQVLPVLEEIAKEIKEMAI